MQHVYSPLINAIGSGGDTLKVGERPMLILFIWCCTQVQQVCDARRRCQSKYGLDCNVRLYCIELLPRVRGGMKIFIRTPDGNDLALEVNGSDTIAVVKSKLAGLTGIAEGVQRLIVDKQVLEDTSSLVQCSIGSGSTLLLAVDACSKV